MTSKEKKLIRKFSAEYFQVSRQIECRKARLTELARETDEIAASLVHLTERKFILAAELDDFLLRLADEQIAPE